MQIFLSTMTDLDYAGIRDVINEAYDDNGATCDRIDRLRKGLKYNYELEVVAKTDDYKLIGHALLNEVTMEADDATYYVLVLESLAVSDAYREQGIAEALLNAVEERAKATGYTTLITIDTPEYFEQLGYETLDTYNIQIEDEVQHTRARVKFLWEQLSDRPHGSIAHII